MATRTVVRSQVRGFAVIWTTITVLIGIATFFAIYLAYDNEADSGSTITLPQQPQEDTGAVAAIPTTDATPVPTLELTTTPVPTATDEPTEVPVVVADASSAEDVTEEDAAEVEAMLLRFQPTRPLMKSLKTRRPTMQLSKKQHQNLTRPKTPMFSKLMMMVLTKKQSPKNPLRKNFPPSHRQNSFPASRYNTAWTSTRMYNGHG